MKDKVFMVIFIVVLGSVLTTTLVAVDNYTAPMIARNQEIKRKASILKAFDIPYQEDEVDALFQEHITVQDHADMPIYVKQDGTIGFVFEGSGLWGPIIGVLALNQDKQTINKVVIMAQEETPGLGSRITEQMFLDRFKSKIFAPDLKMVSEGQSRQNNEIDAITGATMSSVALIDILNDQYQQYRPIISGE